MQFKTGLSRRLRKTVFTRVSLSKGPHLEQNKVNKHRPRRSAAFLIQRLFEGSRITETPLQRNSKTVFKGTMRSKLSEVFAGKEIESKNTYSVWHSRG